MAAFKWCAASAKTTFSSSPASIGPPHHWSGYYYFFRFALLGLVTSVNLRWRRALLTYAGSGLLAVGLAYGLHSLDPGLAWGA